MLIWKRIVLIQKELQDLNDPNNSQIALFSSPGLDT